MGTLTLSVDEDVELVAGLVGAKLVQSDNLSWSGHGVGRLERRVGLEIRRQRAVL